MKYTDNKVAQRKTTGSYWSHLDKAKDLFRDYITQHPEKLGEDVLDPSSGGGSLLIAATEVNREFNKEIRVVGLELLKESAVTCIRNFREHNITRYRLVVGDSLELDWNACINLTAPELQAKYPHITIVEHDYIR